MRCTPCSIYSSLVNQSVAVSLSYLKQTDVYDTKHIIQYSKPGWGMWTWNPVWPPATSLSLRKIEFSQSEIHRYSHTSNWRPLKKVTTFKNFASWRLWNGHLEKYPVTDFSGKDVGQCDRGLRNGKFVCGRKCFSLPRGKKGEKKVVGNFVCDRGLPRFSPFLQECILSKWNAVLALQRPELSGLTRKPWDRLAGCNMPELITYCMQNPSSLACQLIVKHTPWFLEQQAWQNFLPACKETVDDLPGVSGPWEIGVCHAARTSWQDHEQYASPDARPVAFPKEKIIAPHCC